LKPLWDARFELRLAASIRRFAATLLQPTANLFAKMESLLKLPRAGIVLFYRLDFAQIKFKSNLLASKGLLC
jgi:hypothetical protein